MGSTAVWPEPLLHRPPGSRGTAPGGRGRQSQPCAGRIVCTPFVHCGNNRSGGLKEGCGQQCGSGDAVGLMQRKTQVSGRSDTWLLLCIIPTAVFSQLRPSISPIIFDAGCSLFAAPISGYVTNILLPFLPVSYGDRVSGCIICMVFSFNFNAARVSHEEGSRQRFQV